MAGYFLSTVGDDCVDVYLYGDVNTPYYRVFIRPTTASETTVDNIYYCSYDQTVTIFGLSPGVAYYIHVYASASYGGLDHDLGSTSFQTTSTTGYRISIDFDANGGYGAPASISYSSESSMFDILIPYETPSHPNGYTFLGWSMDPGATFSSYTPGEYVWFSYGAYTLYAVWQQYITVVISYDLNGGTGDLPPEQVSGYGPEIYVTITSVQPTWSGYSFLGWAYDPSATEPVFGPGDTGVFTENTTLYAVWGEPQTSGGIVRICINDEYGRPKWATARVYVGNGSQWVAARVYVGNGSQWGVTK